MYPYMMKEEFDNLRCTIVLWQRMKSVISKIIHVIAQFVVWEKPNPSHKCVTQLGTTITVTSIDIPLILVKDKSNTRESS
jgi:hypothetical protein